jgi:hypothetical protein
MVSRIRTDNIEPTSDISNAKDSGMADLLHTTLIGIQRTCSWNRTARLRRTVRKVCLSVGTRLRRWLLHILVRFDHARMRKLCCSE